MLDVKQKMIANFFKKRQGKKRLTTW